MLISLDITGALGIAHSLVYEGEIGEPLYTIDESGRVQDGRNSREPDSFLKECHFKLIRCYDTFYTKEAKLIAQKRKKLTEAFYNELMEEISLPDVGGLLKLIP